MSTDCVHFTSQRGAVYPTKRVPGGGLRIYREWPGGLCNRTLIADVQRDGTVLPEAHADPADVAFAERIVRKVAREGFASGMKAGSNMKLGIGRRNGMTRGHAPKATLNDLTPAQREALLAYKSENGRAWKSRLMADWTRASARVRGAPSGELQQIRNGFGPEWLYALDENAGYCGMARGKAGTSIVLSAHDTKLIQDKGPRGDEIRHSVRRAAQHRADRLGKDVTVYAAAGAGGWVVSAHSPASDMRDGYCGMARGAAGDSVAAHELHLYVNNDADLHRQMLTSIRKNLVTKMARGTYDSARAVDAFVYPAEAMARKHGGARWMDTYSVATRRLAAEMLAREFDAEAATGNFDAYLPKKYAGKWCRIHDDCRQNRTLAAECAASKKGRSEGRLAIAEMVKKHRQENPLSRAPRLFKYVKNTSAVRQMGCIVCGTRGPTWSGGWPKTVRAQRWEQEHEAMHEERGYAGGWKTFKKGAKRGGKTVVRGAKKVGRAAVQTGKTIARKVKKAVKKKPTKTSKKTGRK